jgi:hypothetical protein
MNLLLSRAIDDGKCTTGSITVGSAVYETLERPWVPGPVGGTPGVSCVPMGTYQLVRHDTEAHPRTFAVVNEALGVYHMNVPIGQPGRTVCIYFHIANYVQELRGCGALGMTLDPYMGSYRLGQSKIAVDSFYAAVPWIDGHTLTIERIP